jgi:hypothetical protein
LYVVDDLRVELFERGAQGASTSILAGCALHINAEIPAIKAPTILAYLQAFLLLFDDLYSDIETGHIRRILPHLGRFSREETSFFLRPCYEPTMVELIDDYLRLVRTRNRPLDFLPLLAFVDSEKVLSAAKEPDLIKRRPAMHFRMAHSCIDDPDWTIAAEWNRWMKVEDLAATPEVIREKCFARRRGGKSPPEASISP